jgi:hypothetical protein
MKKFMLHSRDEVPQKICSEKVKNHGSTSRVRSLGKRKKGLVATKEKSHLKTPHRNFWKSNPHA